MKKILFGVLVLFCQMVKAQVQSTATLHPQSVSINIGTQGMGAEYRYGAFSNLSFRGGISVMPVNANNVFEIDGINSDTKVSAKFTNIHLLADYTPFASASFFRLVGGLGYFVHAKGKIDVQPTDSYKYGDIALSQEQVGKLNMDIDWKGVAPYLGIGLIKAFPQRRFNINLDLGTYYLKQPSAKITGTGMLAGNDTQTAQLQKNVNDYRWYPQLQLNFNYRLK
jgi:hypothetical protein